MAAEDEELPSYKGLPAPSTYGTLRDIEVDIPNEARLFAKIAYAPIEVAPISEYMPIDFGGFTASPAPPTAVPPSSSFSPSSSPSTSASSSLSGTPFSFSGPSTSASNGAGCISPSPSFPPSVSAGP